MVRVFSGTNTGNVLADIDVPMLCVPIDAKFKKQKPGLFYDLELRIKALKNTEIGKMANAVVKCLYVK
jgi:hypothetical protein